MPNVTTIRPSLVHQAREQGYNAGITEAARTLGVATRLMSAPQRTRLIDALEKVRNYELLTTNSSFEVAAALLEAAIDADAHMTERAARAYDLANGPTPPTQREAENAGAGLAPDGRTFSDEE